MASPALPLESSTTASSASAPLALSCATGASTWISSTTGVSATGVSTTGVSTTTSGASTCGATISVATISGAWTSGASTWGASVAGKRSTVLPKPLTFKLLIFERARAFLPWAGFGAVVCLLLVEAFDLFLRLLRLREFIKRLAARAAFNSLFSFCAFLNCCFAAFFLLLSISTWLLNVASFSCPSMSLFLIDLITIVSIPPSVKCPFVTASWIVFVCELFFFRSSSRFFSAVSSSFFSFAIASWVLS